MSVRDHSGIALDRFNGLWQRGDADTTPIDHFSDCNNIDYVAQSSFKQRPGVSVSQTVNVPLSNIKRIYNYATQTANTLIVLTYDYVNGIGNIYHVVSPTVVYGPILSIVGMTDFAFVPYAGRGYISPFSSSQPTLASPNILSTALASGIGLSAGNYEYASSFVTPIGETTPSPIVSIITQAALIDPIVAPVITNLGGSGGNALISGQTYKWLLTYTRNGQETNIGPASTGFIAPISTSAVGLEASVALPTFTDPTILVNLYRTIGNGSIYYRELQTSAANFPIVGSMGYMTVGSISDTTLITMPVAPSSNTTAELQVSLTNIPIISGYITNVYRSKVNQTQLQLLTKLTTTSYLDSTADSSLGFNAPSTNTAFVGTNLIDIGMTGQCVYIYAGDGTLARPAAGSGMTGTMTIANGALGHTDPGVHIFGIVSQTISGYNAPPSVLGYFTTAAAASVSFGSIPTSGDPSVVKRLLVSTITIPSTAPPLTPTSDLTAYQFFFVPDAVINNNTDTFLNNISFYDADLLEDASGLLNNYTRIPAGAVLNVYHDRLCVAATATDISLILVSQPGEPEAISQISGLIVVPLDGNPITNLQEYRDVMYVFKRARTVSYVDNGGDPSSWPLTVIDNALGTSVHGIATVLDSGSSSIDFLIICTYQGISLFAGAYVTSMYDAPTNELTWKVEDYWKQLDRTQFNQIQIVNDPIQKKIYCVLPGRNMLVGDYANGLDFKGIRWSPWSFRMGVNTIAIQNINDIILGADIQ